MRFHYSRVHRLYLVPALGLVFALAITACSSSGSSSSSAATSAPAATTSAATASSSAAAGGTAVAQITANWEAFFNPATPNSKRVQLLENGSEFASAISAFSASPLAQQVSSKVDSVSVTSATKANVKYDLTAAGTSVASGQTGTSVLQDGVWKVGDDVFCGLLKEGASLLNISVPAACNSAS
jgi:purine-cytosine permease-like protein